MKDFCMPHFNVNGTHNKNLPEEQLSEKKDLTFIHQSKGELWWIFAEPQKQQGKYLLLYAGK